MLVITITDELGIAECVTKNEVSLSFRLLGNAGAQLLIDQSVREMFGCVDRADAGSGEGRNRYGPLPALLPYLKTSEVRKPQSDGLQILLCDIA